MALVKRGNIEKRISDSAVQEYLSKGYDVLDSDGHVITKAIPTDIGNLRIAYEEAMKEIENLKAENAKLKQRKSAKQ